MKVVIIFTETYSRNIVLMLSGKGDKTRNFATRITIIYILAGSIWILFSDELMFVFFKDTRTLNLVSTYKGWGYVLFTGILLYLLIKKELQKRNAIEEELKLSRDKAEESDKLKTAFLQNISHEIRTPMNAIIGFSELLSDPELNSDQKMGFATFIRRGIADLLATIDDIIIVSRIQVGQVKVENTKGDVAVFLNELNEYFLAQLYAQKRKKVLNLVLHIRLKPEETMIMADFRNLRQILNKLLSNAVKFTDHGSVELSCEKLPSNTLLFMVKDSGCGIPQSKKDIVFHAFRQVAEIDLNHKTDGTGLGLTIAKGLVELMKGKIWFESEEGKGCTFYFTVPFIQEPEIRIQPDVH